jgi:hypothetical protein
MNSQKSRKQNDLYDVNKYTESELFTLLDLTEPSDRILEAKILLQIDKYKEVATDEGSKLTQFFTDIYDRFFETTDENENQEGFDNMEQPPNDTQLETNTIVPDSITKYDSSTKLVKALDYTIDNLNPLLKETVKRILSIDSQFRDKSVYPLSTNFSFNLSEPLKDVLSLKLYSLQIPYTWYTISNAFGSNFFYINGISPGINNGNYNFKIVIPNGTYTAAQLVDSVNSSITTIKNQNTDISFNTTNISYNTTNSLATITADITQIYNETNYYLDFSGNWSSPNNNSSLTPIQTINEILGFNDVSYNMNSVYSMRTVSNTIDNNKQNGYYIDNSNNYFTIYQYVGPNEYSNTSQIIQTIKIQLSGISLAQIDPSNQTSYDLITQHQLVDEINSQLAQNQYLIDSSLNLVNITDPGQINNGNSYFDLSIKLNRNITTNLPNLKTVVIFPNETSPNQHLWTGHNSALEFGQTTNELNNILAETQTPPNNYSITSSPYFVLLCTKQYDASFVGTNPINNYNISYSYRNNQAFDTIKSIYDTYTDLFNNKITLTNSGNYNGIYSPAEDFNISLYSNGAKINNDYIMTIPSSPSPYTIKEYIDAINTAFANTNNLAGGDFQNKTLCKIDPITDQFKFQFDIIHTFNEKYYTLDITDSILNNLLGLNFVSSMPGYISPTKIDLSGTSVFSWNTNARPGIPLLGNYAQSYIFMTVSPTQNASYGNKNDYPYIINYGWRNPGTNDLYIIPKLQPIAKKNPNGNTFTDYNPILGPGNNPSANGGRGDGGITFSGGYNSDVINGVTNGNSSFDNTQIYSAEDFCDLVNHQFFKKFTAIDNQKPLTQSILTIQTDPSNNTVWNCTLTIKVNNVLTEQDYTLLLYDPASNGTWPTFDSSGNIVSNTDPSNSWATNLFMADQSYNLSNSQIDLSGTQISMANGSHYISQNVITITAGQNDTFWLKTLPVQNYTPNGYYDLPITVPANTYTLNLLIEAINTALNNYTDASGSQMSTYIPTQHNPYNKTYVKFRPNINRIFTAKDYSIVFYNEESFTTCAYGSNAIQNVTWDTTLGWILGFQELLSYNFADLSSNSPNSPANPIIQMSGETAVNVNLYNYFLITFDTYSPNYLNDGLITITGTDSQVSLPYYANMATNVCDPILGRSELVGSVKPTNNLVENNSNSLTQNQLYALNEIIIARQPQIKLYSPGPFVSDVFAIVPLKTAGLQQGSSYVEFGGSLQNQDRTFFGPVDIKRVSIKLLSDRGNVIDLNGANWSFSILCETLYKQK